VSLLYPWYKRIKYCMKLGSSDCFFLKRRNIVPNTGMITSMIINPGSPNTKVQIKWDPFQQTVCKSLKSLISSSITQQLKKFKRVEEVVEYWVNSIVIKETISSLFSMIHFQKISFIRSPIKQYRITRTKEKHMLMKDL